MQGHTDLGLDSLIKFRVEPDLKRQLTAIARKQRKPTAQMIREALWQIVEREDVDPDAVLTEPATGEANSGSKA